MSILGLYSHMWWDAPEADQEEDDAPEWPSEALTASHGLIWWTAAPILDTDD